MRIQSLFVEVENGPKPNRVTVATGAERQTMDLPALDVDLFEKPLPAREPGHGQLGVGGDGTDAHVGRHEILIDDERAVPCAKEAGKLAMEDRAVEPPHQRADLHPGRQPARLAQRVEDGAKGRKVCR